MKFTVVAKEIVRPIILNPNINSVLTSLLKFLKPFIPKKILYKIPKVGIVTCDLSNSKKLSLFSEGHEINAPRLYFEGLDGLDETMRLFSRLATNSEVVLDIGANTGIYALIAAIEDPGRKVYAFEPVPRIYQRLEKNVEINKVTNLHTNSSAVTNFDGTITLYVTSGPIPYSSSTLREHRATTEETEEIQSKAITIDSYVKTENISKVDLMKIDTEGTEHLVLEGAIQTIERDKPMIICEVLKGLMTERKLQAILDNLSYRYFWITGTGLIERKLIEGDEKYEYLNYLFIHPDNVNRISNLIQTQKD